MSLVRRVMLALLLGGMLAQPIAAQPARPPEEAMKAAREFVDASGAAAQFDQIMPLIMDQMTKAFVTLAPERAGEIRETMSEVLKRIKADKAGLIEEISAIYAEKLSIKDLREITKFFRSGAGRRMIVALPEVTRQAAAAGEAWGLRIGAEIETEMRRELKKRGIDL